MPSAKILIKSQKAAPIGVEKLAYARLLNILAIIQSVLCHWQR